MTQINRKLHEALGRTGKPLDYCGDPRLVIEAMREREDWTSFYEYCTYRFVRIPGAYSIYIAIDLIMDRTGKLAKLGTEWIKQKGKSNG